MLKNKWIFETCKKCGKRNVVGFIVDDNIWEKVHENYNILCPPCFDELAEEKQIEYKIKDFYFVSWADNVEEFNGVKNKV
jgi:hypothetical protein